ncbi:hypothetical protein SAMN02745181_0294 [Rubritalea squalenifaciens DSM 18772]|uniref:Uncharacterized protein n=1 Tax=Rubritalea squalenifaciens DSM 18772 TaxID=1123071 RepID=A0A1M6BSC2_9BACT|nr:hypothetical protein [Rubritalea squalenifaciens]SHI51494.1 hypothetical protein SAMN02745181_0294 [Rubritalea squalenifaciens DSM 18772]
MKNLLTIAALLSLSCSLHAKELKAKPFPSSDLASYLNLYAASFELTASGKQESFGSRIVVYLDGKEIASSTLSQDGTGAGKRAKQEYSIVLEDNEEGIKFWIQHNNASRRGLLEIPKKHRPDTFLPTPAINKDGSITFAVKDTDNGFNDEDMAPSTGHLVIVLETKESHE